MSTSLLSFLGIQLASLALMGGLLFTHWRVCARREHTYQQLGDQRTKQRRRSRGFLIAAYVLTTILIAIVSGYFFLF